MGESNNDYDTFLLFNELTAYIITIVHRINTYYFLTTLDGIFFLKLSEKKNNEISFN